MCEAASYAYPKLWTVHSRLYQHRSHRLTPRSNALAEISKIKTITYTTIQMPDSETLAKSAYVCMLWLHNLNIWFVFANVSGKEGDWKKWRQFAKFLWVSSGAKLRKSCRIRKKCWKMTILLQNKRRWCSRERTVESWFGHTQLRSRALRERTIIWDHPHEALRAWPRRLEGLTSQRDWNWARPNSARCVLFSTPEIYFNFFKSKQTMR